MATLTFLLCLSIHWTAITVGLFLKIIFARHKAQAWYFWTKQVGLTCIFPSPSLCFHPHFGPFLWMLVHILVLGKNTGCFAISLVGTVCIRNVSFLAGKHSLFLCSWNIEFPIQGADLRGGYMQGVCNPSCPLAPEMTCGLVLIQLVSCVKICLHHQS